MNAGGHCNFEFGAHAIGAGDQQWVLVAATEKPLEVELEECGKASFGTHHPGALRAAHVRRQPRHSLAVKFQINSSARIGGSKHSCVLQANCIAGGDQKNAIIAGSCHLASPKPPPSVCTQN